jgi:5-methylcytosine-specific restriction endonuclease McrA
MAPARPCKNHPDRESVRTQRLCRECAQDYQRAWKKANVEKARDYDRAWKKANVEKARATKRAWREANPEKASGTRTRANVEKGRARLQAWRAANPEKARACDRAWYDANPDKVRARKHRRRARLKDGVSPGVTPSEWRTILKQCGHACRYCGATGVRLTRDHVVAIAAGGRDEPGNLVPACKSCNSAKGARELVVWLFSRVSLATEND